MSEDTKPVTERQKYLDEKIAEAEGAADKANATLQERDSEVAQAREKAGVGEDNTDENTRVLVAQMRKRADLFEKNGNTKKAAEIRARIKEMTGGD